MEAGHRRGQAKASEARRVAAAEAGVARRRRRSGRGELERLTVKAPVDGTVLQVKIHQGEFATAGVLATPLMVLGGRRHAGRARGRRRERRLAVRDGREAVAFVRGNRDLRRS